jgi:hypothetical protein
MFRACVAEGLTKEDIIRVMQISDGSFVAIEKRVLANDGQRFLSKSSAHRYYEYCLQQEQCARDLDYFVQATYESVRAWQEAVRATGNLQPGEKLVARKGLGPMPSPQAAILAIKARSEILDRVVKTGQDMGIIEKRARELRLSGQINLAALPTEKLRVFLEKKLNEMQKLVDKGDIPPTFRKMLKGQVAGTDDGERSDEPESVVDAPDFVETDSRSVG